MNQRAKRCAIAALSVFLSITLIGCNSASTSNPKFKTFVLAASELNGATKTRITYDEYTPQLKKVIVLYQEATAAQQLSSLCYDAVTAWSVTGLLWYDLAKVQGETSVIASRVNQSDWARISGESANSLLRIDDYLIAKGLTIAGQKWGQCVATIP